MVLFIVCLPTFAFIYRESSYFFLRFQNQIIYSASFWTELILEKPTYSWKLNSKSLTTHYMIKHLTHNRWHKQLTPIFKTSMTHHSSSKQLIFSVTPHPLSAHANNSPIQMPYDVLPNVLNVPGSARTSFWINKDILSSVLNGRPLTMDKYTHHR